jgi:hypothetical protein
MGIINVVVKERCPILIPVSDAFIINAVVKDGNSIVTYVDYPEKRNISMLGDMLLDAKDIRAKYKIHYDASISSFILSQNGLHIEKKQYMNVGNAFILDIDTMTKTAKKAEVKSDMLLDGSTHAIIYAQINGLADMILEQSADLFNRQIKYTEMQNDNILDLSDVRNKTDKKLKIGSDLILDARIIDTIAAKLASGSNDMIIDSTAHGILHTYVTGENGAILDVGAGIYFDMKKFIDVASDMLIESTDTKTLSFKSISQVAEFILEENTVRVYASADAHISSSMVLEDTLSLYELRNRIFADMDNFTLSKFDQFTLTELDTIRNA